MAKKTPKKNNAVEAASLSLSFNLGKEKLIAPDKYGHWEIVND